MGKLVTFIRLSRKMLAMINLMSAVGALSREEKKPGVSR